MNKLYIIVRADLPPGAQLAQSIHGAQEFAIQHRDLFEKWHKESNTIVCLSIENEFLLDELAYRAFDEKIKYSTFFEPDMNEELTCLVLDPFNEKSRQICSSLPLALRK